MKRKNPFSFYLRNLSVILAMFLANFHLSGQTVHTVQVTNNVYTPDEITITAGDEVVWNNTQGNHNVNGTQTAFPSNPESFGNNVGSGWTFSHVFTIPGVYDYQCDPHTAFNMYGKVIVEEAVFYTLTLNFSGMTPHVGQSLWLRAENADTKDQVFRSVFVVEQAFSLVIPGLEEGESYLLEFFSDHNNNGQYDAPPTDHAWSLSLNNVSGDESVDFTHNTAFTDIEWEHQAVINLDAMDPHVGQEIYFALIENSSGEIVDRKSETVSESFSVVLSEIEPGKSYHINFYTDHNENGSYDAPPVDHAWSVNIDNASGDDTINFGHNTSFVDIDWQHRLRVKFSEMTPHVGQALTFYIRDNSTGELVDSTLIDQVEAEFDIVSYAIEVGQTYDLDFFADHNGNGIYDSPPVDHAWRLSLGEIVGDTEIEFTHNAGFTDIFALPTLIQEDAAGSFRIYPVPATDHLFLELNSGIRAVTIYSVSGKIMASYEETGVRQVRVSLESFEPGMYLVKASNKDNLAEVFRFIKQ